MSSEPRHESRFDLEGPPAARGRHPADVSADAWESRHVRRLRARGVPWPHIARQVGKCERALRAIYEPILDVQIAAAPARPPRSRPRDVAPGTHPGVFVGLRPVRDSIAFLIAIDHAPGLGASEIAERLGVGREAGRLTLDALRDRGWARNLDTARNTPGCWTTTEAGRAELARREGGE